MSTKTLKILLAGLTLLLAVWGIVSVASRTSAREGATPSPALAAFFGDIAEESVTRVRMSGPRDTVSLERRGSPNAWAANGFRADSGAVSRLWQAFAAARNSGEVVATSATNHGRLGLNADSAWLVELEGAGRTRAIMVGNAGIRPHTSYVRFPDADTAFLVDGDLHLRVAYSTDDWRDRKILGIDTSMVTRIAVSLDNQGYTLVRGAGSGWRFEGGAEVDTTAARIILTELRYLHAAGFLEPGDTIATKPLGGRVVALTATGDTLASLTLGARGGDRWARTRGDSTLYRLAYYRVERVAPTRKQLTRRP